MTQTEYPKSSPTGVLRQSLNQLAKDVITLCELQAELLQVDLRDWLRRCVAPTLALVAVAAVLALASMPLALLSLAYCLVEFAGLSIAASMLIAAAAGLAAAAACGFAAWRIVKRERGTFERFNVELTNNLRWLKQVLSRSTPAAGPEPR
jgi:Putative Actinobacterial Holin-X, holin superfamily III